MLIVNLLLGLLYFIVPIPNNLKTIIFLSVRQVVFFFFFRNNKTNSEQVEIYFICFAQCLAKQNFF